MGLGAKSGSRRCELAASISPHELKFTAVLYVQFWCSCVTE